MMRRLLIPFAVVLWLATPAESAPALAAANNAWLTNTATNTGVSKAFGSNTTAGNFIAVVVITGFNSTSGVTYTVTDGTNTYMHYGSDNQSAQFQVDIFYAKNIAGGAVTVTATLDGGLTGSIGLAIGEFTGVDTTAPEDATTQNNGNGTTSSTGAITASTNALIIGAMIKNQNATITPPGGAWAEAFRYSEVGSVVWQVGSGSQNVNGWTHTTAAWYTCISSFKEAAGGGGPTGPPAGSLLLGGVGK